MQITLPWPDSALSPNARKHWKAKLVAKNEARDAGWFATMQVTDRQSYIPNGEIEMRLEFRPPDYRRRDQDNILASLKFYLDGIFRALGVDDALVRKTVLLWGDKVAGGEVIVHIGALQHDKDTD